MKLVRENINFERTDNPLRNMSIGRRTQIEKWLEEMEVKNYTINEDLTIDVKESVDLRNENLSSFPPFIKFRNVGGGFYCDRNQLTSLEGCPQSVGGNFFCNSNQLTSLEGCPQSVGGNFYCNGNRLTSLEGGPQSVGGDFCCSGNKKKFSEEEVRKFCDVKENIQV